MAQREKTEITIETEHRLIIRHRRVERRWCQNCGHETDFVPYEASLQLKDLLIHRGEQSELHMLPTSDSKWLLCLESLFRVAQSALVNRGLGGGGKNRP